MFDLCRELGMDVYPQYDKGDIIMHLDGVNRRYQGLPKVGLFGLIGLGLGFWGLDRMVKRLPLAEPWKARGARVARCANVWCVVRFAMERTFSHGAKADQHDNDNALLRRPQ